MNKLVFGIILLLPLAACGVGDDTEDMKKAVSVCKSEVSKTNTDAIFEGYTVWEPETSDMGLYMITGRISHNSKSEFYACRINENFTTSAPLMTDYPLPVGFPWENVSGSSELGV